MEILNLNKKIRLLIVDDSETIRRIVKEVLLAGENIEVIAEAKDGKEGFEKAIEYKPDVILMNIIMPGYDGLWGLYKIMTVQPTPVILFSSLAEIDTDLAEEGYRLGAFDIILKPAKLDEIVQVKQELVYKIKAASFVDKARLSEYMFLPKISFSKGLKGKISQRALLIVSSAGGVAPLRKILLELPKDFPAGIIVGQHISPILLRSLVNSISSVVSYEVKIGKKGDFVRDSTVIFSPVGVTLTLYKISKGYIVGTVDAEKNLQPDFNTMLINFASNFGSNAIICILQGLDIGAPIEGAKEVKKEGGVIIAQDAPFGMSKLICNYGLADYIAPPEKITDMILEVFEKKILKFTDEINILGVLFKLDLDYSKLSINEFPSEIRKFLSEISYNQYYSFKLYCEFLNIIVNKSPIEDLARNQMKRFIDELFLSEFRKINSFQDALQTLSFLFSKIFKNSHFKIEKMEKNYAQMRVENIEFKEECKNIFLKIFNGYFNEIFNRYKIKTKVVEQENKIIFEINW
jgi:two-component system chemotaxis response regulator CheB